MHHVVLIIPDVPQCPISMRLGFRLRFELGLVDIGRYCYYYHHEHRAHCGYWRHVGAYHLVGSGAPENMKVHVLLLKYMYPGINVAHSDKLPNY